MNIMSILKFLTIFDWITPAAGIVQDAAYGPSHTFEISEGGEWSGRDVEKLLKRNGIKSWAHMGLPGKSGRIFTVEKRQAVHARRVLSEAGVEGV